MPGELFPRPEYRDIVSAIEGRLPQTTFLVASDVAAGAQVDVNTVYAWIDEGHIEAVNIGARGQPYYHILRSSVIDFFRRRMVGAGNKEK